MDLRSNLPSCLDVNWDAAIAEYEAVRSSPKAVQFPRVYQLETTSLCNLACIMCPRKDLTRPETVMSKKLFKTIVKRDLKGTKAIELFGFGEPFTDPYLGDRIAYLHSRGIYVVIATNGLLLADIEDKIIKEIDYLVFDVDATDEEQYLSVRVGGDYSLMLDNLERVLSIREKYTVLQYINLDPARMHTFFEKYEGRADEVRIKFVDTFAGQVGEKPEGKLIKHGKCCLEVFYGVSIWSNGDVVMCDRDFNSVLPLGNVKQDSLYHIWHSDYARRVRGLHEDGDGDLIRLCSQCKEWSLTNLRNVPELTVNMFKGGFV